MLHVFPALCLDVWAQCQGLCCVLHDLQVVDHGLPLTPNKFSMESFSYETEDKGWEGHSISSCNTLQALTFSWVCTCIIYVYCMGAWIHWLLLPPMSWPRCLTVYLVCYPCSRPFTTELLCIWMLHLQGWIVKSIYFLGIKFVLSFCKA